MVTGVWNSLPLFRTRLINGLPVWFPRWTYDHDCSGLAQRRWRLELRAQKGFRIAIPSQTLELVTTWFYRCSVVVSSWFNRDSIWLQTKIICVEISRNRFISPFEAEVISEIFACMIIAMTVRRLRPEVIPRICCIASLNLSCSASIGDVIPLRAVLLLYYWYLHWMFQTHFPICSAIWTFPTYV